MQNWLFDIRSRSFVLLTTLFLIITALVFFNVTESFDQSVISFFAQNTGNSGIDIFMQYVTESGDVFNMMAFGILILLIPKNPSNWDHAYDFDSYCYFTYWLH